MSMKFTFDALIALINSNMWDTSGCWKLLPWQQRHTFVTLLFEGSWSSYLGRIFFVPVEFCSTIYYYGNNVAMATDKCLSDCATRWATKLFLTKSCAEIIASGRLVSLNIRRHCNNHRCTFQILGGCQGRSTGVAVTTVSNSLILGGWVTKVLKNGDKN